MNIPLFRINWSESDIDAVADVIRSGKYWCIGPQIEELETEISEMLSSQFCVTFNSGGSALYAAMQAHGFSEGDEIIVPSFTFVATAYAPLYVGATPIFADVETDTFGLNPNDVRNRLTDRTKAIIPVHYGGMPCHIRELRKIAENHNLILIEDAAESFGAKIENDYIGTYGDSSIFSFCQNKIFTTSEGGCVVTNEEAIYEKLKRIRSYGRVTRGDYFSDPNGIEYHSIGHNLRLSSILAALGLSQLERIDDIVAQRRQKARFFSDELASLDELILPAAPNKDYFEVYQMYTIRVREGAETRNRLMEHLSSKGISSRIYFEPVHKYRIFDELGFPDVNLPTTSLLANQVLSLPVFPDLRDEEMHYIVKQVREFFENQNYGT